MLNRAIVPFALFMLIAAFLEAVFFFSGLAATALALGAVVIISAVYYLIPGYLEQNRIYFTVFPLLILLAFFAYIILQSEVLFIQILIFLCPLVIFFYFRAIYYYFHKPGSYRTFSIENISSYGGFMAFFLFGSSFFGYQSALVLPLWTLAPFLLIFTFFLVNEVFWMNKIEYRKGILHIFTAIIIIMELAWAISYLPTNYNVAGMCLVIFYYMLIGVLKHHLAGNLEPRVVKLYLGIGGISLILVLLTSRWI